MKAGTAKQRMLADQKELLVFWATRQHGQCSAPPPPKQRLTLVRLAAFERKCQLSPGCIKQPQLCALTPHRQAAAGWVVSRAADLRRHLPAALLLPHSRRGAAAARLLACCRGVQPRGAALCYRQHCRQAAAVAVLGVAAAPDEVQAAHPHRLFLPLAAAAPGRRAGRRDGAKGSTRQRRHQLNGAAAPCQCQHRGGGVFHTAGTAQGYAVDGLLLVGRAPAEGSKLRAVRLDREAIGTGAVFLV